MSRKGVLSRYTYLAPMDLWVLMFSTLIINLFSLTVPLITLQIYDRILSFHSIGTLNVLCIGGCVIVLLDTILKLSRSSLIGWTSAKFEHAAYTNAIDKLTQTPLNNNDQTSQGEALHNLGAISKLKSFYSGQSLVNLIDLPFVLIFLGFITYLAGWLVIVPLTLLTLFGLYAAGLGHTIRKSLDKRSHNDDQRINFVSEILEKIHTVKMLGLEPSFIRHHESLCYESAEDNYRVSLNNTKTNNAGTFFTQIMMISMISIGALMVLDGQITMGILIACVLLSGRIMQPVQRALSFWVSFQEYELSKEKIGSIFKTLTIPKIDADTLEKPKGKLEVKTLDFSFYEDTGPFLFSNLNLTIKPGQIIALSGPPGDGKTTLLKLIAGLIKPTGGQILIDGIESCRYPNSEIAKHVGYLPSKSEIFHGTILENITSFRPELDETALEIAGYLGIDRIVSKLAKGYQTLLVDGPADPLTPGIKQRITICRVLVNKPKLILFDFADKALDKEGYNHLFKLLGQIRGQASMILVSNDRNLLHLAEDEYVIEDGSLKPIKDSRYKKISSMNIPLRELLS